MVLNPQQLKELITSTETDNLKVFLPLICASLRKEVNEKALPPIINNLLSGSNSSRCKAFFLLENTITCYSESTFIEYGHNWCSHCIGKHATNDTFKHTKISVLEQILKLTVNCDQFNRRFLSEHMPDFLKMILGCNINDSRTIISIKCLSLCMPRFSAWFGNHRDKIEQFLVQHLDSNNRNSVQVAAIAFHYFQQTGNAGAESVNYSNNFLAQSKKLSATIHVLFDELLGQFRETTDWTKIQSSTFQLKSSEAEYSDLKNVELFSKELENCLVFLQTMIREKFPAQKVVALKHFVDVIHRGLSFHECESDDLALEKNFLLNRFYDIQIELLELLRLILIGFFSGLRPFNFVISKTLLNSVKRSSTCNCLPIKHQEFSYKVLKKWILLGGYFNLKQTETLISILMENIKPKKKQVTLSLAQSKKKKSSAPLPIKKEDVNLVATCARTTLCNYSLQTLKEICSRSFTIKRENLKDCIHLCVKLVAEVQTNRMLPPYNEEICQVSLYELLVEFLHQELSRYLVPMNLVVGLLNGGLHNERPRIAEACRNGLVIAEIICQPLCTPLGFEKREESESRKVVENLTKAAEVAHAESEEEEQMQVKNKEDEKLDEENQEEDHQDHDEDMQELVENEAIEGEPIVSFESEDDADDEVVEINDNSSNESIQFINVAKEKTNEKIVVETEEPPIKKQKSSKVFTEADKDLNEMLASFRDIVQEQE